MQYQVDVQISVPDVGENQKSANGTGREYLKNGSHDFLQISWILLDAFSNVLFLYCSKIDRRFWFNLQFSMALSIPSIQVFLGLPPFFLLADLKSITFLGSLSSFILFTHLNHINCLRFVQHFLTLDENPHHSFAKQTFHSLSAGKGKLKITFGIVNFMYIIKIDHFYSF